MFRNLEDPIALLNASSAGDGAAHDRLLELVYAELRRVAGNYLRRERSDHSLQPTALVHEAYLRLVGQTQVEWQGREHFMGVAAQMMRRVLVDHARNRARVKRGAAPAKISLSEADRLNVSRASSTATVDFTALDSALTELEALDGQKSRVVELRYFGGFSIEETARILRVSTATVERDWRFAKAFLHRELARN